MAQKVFEIPIELHPKQELISNSNKRFKIVRAGRKFGKSTLAFYEFIKALGVKNAKVWYIAPTYKQAKLIAWWELKNLIPHQVLVKKPNETELMFELKNGSIGYLMGADDEDSLRGPNPTFIILDEAAMVKDTVWEKVLRPNLMSKEASCLFISTPKGLNWFHDIWMEGEKNPGLWGLYHHTVYDNPYVKREEIEAARRDCKSEIVWRQEYMAEFEANAGRVFSEFNLEKHTGLIQPPSKDQLVYRAIDWGLRDNTACVWGYKAEKLCVFDLHLQSGLAASQQAELIRSKSLNYKIQRTTLSHDAFRQDPELMSRNAALQFAKMGISCIPASKDKLGGISLLKALFNQDRIILDKVKCAKLITQIQNYEWKNTEFEKTEDGDDDAVDALRYLVQSVNMDIKLEEPVSKEPYNYYVEASKEHHRFKTKVSDFTQIDDYTGYPI